MAYVGYLYRLQSTLQKQQQISDTRHVKGAQSRKPLNEQAHTSSVAYSEYEKYTHQRTDLSKRHFYKRRAVFK